VIEDPLIGKQLGNFRVERLLGRGGMAQVYHGVDVNLERPVAIKVIDARYRTSPAYAARFIQEARAVATWRHEHIVQIYYADEQDGLYYFAMEYLEGLDLHALLSQYADEGELIPHEDVLQLGHAIAEALDYAHQRGVVHRDIKPSNVMVTDDGRVVLTDFGLALDIERGSVGEVFGSPHYIAPEQAQGSANAVPQSDLYSLGVILYEMLTGVVPFDDPSTMAVAIQHITQPPPPPRDLNPALNPQVEEVLLKALQKSPEARYQTGAELLAALEEALQAGSVEEAALPELPPPPPGVVPPAQRPLSLISVDEKVTSHLQAQSPEDLGKEAPLTPDSSLVGRQLDEYRLEELLGHGGMAQVYRGIDVRLNRPVAIKIIDTPFRADADYLMRFEREAQAIARLEHPHIVRLYRYGEADGLLYMAMQYVDGADLGWVLEDYRNTSQGAGYAFIEPEEAVRITREVCEALDYAHNQGVIHRDVKPANIMLTKEGTAILADFGLALLTEAGTRGLIFGSPHYIAPEQAISSANVVPQSDIYAVGVILYEMFTGQVPFEAEDPLDIAMLHMTERPRPPRELRPDLSPAVEAVILKAMAQEPEARYATGRALADALEQAWHGMLSPEKNQRASIAQRVSIKTAKPSPLKPQPEEKETPGAISSSAVAPETAMATSKRRPPLLYAGLVLIVLVLVALAILFLLPDGKGEEQIAGLTPTRDLLMTLSPTQPVGATGTADAIAASGVTETAQTVLQPPTATHEAPSPTDNTPGRVVSATHPSLTEGQVPTSTALLPTATGTLPPPTEQAPTPTAPLPTATEQAPTPTTSPPSPTSVTSPSYNLHFYKEGKESVVMVNQAEDAFPLTELSLGNERAMIAGADWGITTLPPGACVGVWQSEGDKEEDDDDDEDDDERSFKISKDADCDLVGERLVSDSKFWEHTFTVYYNESELGACEKKDKQCTLTRSASAEEPPISDIPLPASYDLRFYKEGKESVVMANQAEDAFPLTGLRIDNERAMIAGADWGLTTLSPGACVVVWHGGKNEDDLKISKDADCDLVSERLVSDSTFWEHTFTIYYNESQLGTCEKKDKQCVIRNKEDD
jgi:serine/threonine protein kinase